MKHIPLIILLVINGTLGAICQSKPVDPPAATYKVFTGKVGNQDAIMHLNIAGENRFGYIYFKANQWPMFFHNAYKEKNNDSLTLGATVGALSLVMTGLFNGEQFNGRCELSNAGSAPRRAGFTLKESREAPYTPFNYSYAEGLGKLPPDFKNESTCVFLSAAPWPEKLAPEAKVFETALTKLIAAETGMKPPATDLTKHLHNEKNKTIDGWKAENAKMKPSEAAEMGLSLSLEIENKLMVMFENAERITLAHFVHMYSGGAHGNYSTTIANINKGNGKLLKLTDVLTPDGIKMLPAALDATARVQFGVKTKTPLDQNGFMVNKIEPSQQFYITESGLGFVYAPYEVRPFSDGEVTLQVPMALIKGFLKPDFK